MTTIAIDARFLTRKQRGMPAYVSKLCATVPENMPDAKFILLINESFEHNDDKRYYSPRIDAIAQQDNVEIVNIDAEDERSWEIFKLPTFLRNTHVDLLHMPTNRVCMLTSVPQITTVHDCMEWKYLEQNHGIPKGGSLKEKFYHWRKLIYVKLNYLYGVARKADSIITVSNFARNSIHTTFGVKKSKITVCYHGLPKGFKGALGIPLSQRSGVLMLGGESYQKNCENAIAAYAGVPAALRKQHKLTICSYKKSEGSLIAKAIARFGIESDVVLLDWVETHELVDLFCRNRAFLFVSREEGFGFPLLQALHCATPTVISDADVLREIAGPDYPNAPAEAPTSMAEVLERFLEDDAFWQATSTKSTEEASRFDWQQSIDKHISAYRELLV